MAVFAASDHRQFQGWAFNLPPLSTACNWFKRVVNFLLTWPFCCCIPGAVYSKWTPNSSYLQAFSKVTCSHSLLQHRFFISRLYIFFKFLTKPIMTSARLDFSFKKKLQMKSLLSSMTSSQCFLTKVVEEGELMSKKCLSPKILDWGTAFLLTANCLALAKVQSLHGVNILVNWIPRALAVAWVIDSDGWTSSTCRLLIFFLQGVVADYALLLLVSQRNSSTATQSSWVLVQWSRMILPSSSLDLTTMLSCWLLEIGFPNLTWGKTSWAIECEPTHSHQLVQH